MLSRDGLHGLHAHAAIAADNTAVSADHTASVAALTNATTDTAINVLPHHHQHHRDGPDRTVHRQHACREHRQRSRRPPCPLTDHHRYNILPDEMEADVILLYKEE